MPSLVRIRPEVWEKNGDKQTNKQTDTPFCFIYINKIFVLVPPPLFSPTRTKKIVPPPPPWLRAAIPPLPQVRPHAYV